ncbi:Leucine rich repeat-containing protein, partial [Ruminococcus sp. YRD2003]|uniref:leucine-rich repeat protein n=1 Tax=Ruminococcus sp. YRD2003 TaxID=1452313 RepID=UPI0008AF749B
IPKSVKSTGNQFDGCLQGSSIEKVVFEEGIENIPENICFNASNVKEVILPEKEDIIDGYRIGDRAFRNTAITSIDLPKSLTQIGASAFRDCAYLTSIDIPDNVTSVGDSSFAGCKRLSNIRFGTGVKSLGANLLDGAVSMKEFTLPATVTSTGNQFDGCLQGSSVATLNIDGGAKKVPDNLAYNCKSLKTVNFPDSVSEIGARSFKNCNELSTINSNRKQFSFSSSSFDNCTSLEDPRFTIMDRMNTYLAVNSEQSSKNGVSNYTLKYSINADAASVSNIKINLGIPEGMTLLLDSITSKGVNVTESDIQSGIIPVDSISGEIRFSARVTDIGKYTVSANISFKNKNEEWNQLIGKTSVECPDITISVPETVNSLSADVFGFAPGGEDVELYVNDILVDTVKSSGYTSKYSANIKLPKGESGTEYKLYAICGDLKSDTVTTTYSVDKPAVTKVIFGFNNHTDSTMDITDVLTKGISPVLSYNPAYPLSFEITATNNQNIDRMFVTSTKGENIKYLEAFYNEKSGTWKAKGFFDPANHSYVPGMYNISIIEKENIVVGENYDPEKDQTFEDIPQEYRDNSSVEVIKQDGDSYLAEVTVSNGIQSDSFPIYSDSNSDGLFIDGVFVKTEEIAKDPVKYGFTPTPVHTSDDGVKADYYVYTPDSKDIVATMMLGYSDELKEAKDLWTGKAVLKMIESDFVDPDDPKVSLINAFILEDTKTVMKSVLGESYSSISKGLSVGKDFFRYYGEMAMADGNEDYEAAATALFVLKCVNTFATSALLASVGIYPPLSTIISWEIGRCLDRADEYLVDCMQNGRQFSLVGCIRYILDPSGIVYEGVLGNPVDGATVTVYYKDEATGKQIKWNAEDYEQMNPLLTDSEGKYLWDVPEGEWKVVCEMEGYDTAETEWMTIPPVRTEVNIALVSHEAPVVESVTRNGNEITMKLTKFADIKTVTNKSVSIEGFSGAFTVSPQLIDADDKYADTFILSGEFGDSIGDVSITSDVVSYAGVAAKKSAATPVETSITAGDVNDDNTVNLKDVVLINRFIAGGWNVTINTAAADVDKDGEVTLKDTVLIRRSIAGGWESAA